MILKEMLQNKK